MKFLLLIGGFIIIHSFPCAAQYRDSVFHAHKAPFIYLEAGRGFAKFNVYEVRGNFILQNNWGCNIGLDRHYHNSQELPADYSNGSLLSSGPPRDITSFYTVRVTKGWNTPLQLIRFKAEAGFVFANYEKVHFQKIPLTGGWFSSDNGYYHEYSDDQSYGITTRAVAEIPFTQVLGFQVAAVIMITTFKSYFGMEFNVILGYTREKLKTRK